MGNGERSSGRRPLYTARHAAPAVRWFARRTAADMYAFKMASPSCKSVNVRCPATLRSRGRRRGLAMACQGRASVCFSQCSLTRVVLWSPNKLKKIRAGRGRRDCAAPTDVSIATNGMSYHHFLKHNCWRNFPVHTLCTFCSVFW